MVWHLLAAHCAEENGVEGFELLKSAFRNVVTVLEIGVRAPRKMLYVKAKSAVALRQHFQRFQSRSDNFGANSVAAYGSNFVGLQLILLFVLLRVG
jgi:hypothetical protein